MTDDTPRPLTASERSRMRQALARDEMFWSRPNDPAARAQRAQAEERERRFEAIEQEQERRADAAVVEIDALIAELARRERSAGALRWSPKAASRATAEVVAKVYITQRERWQEQAATALPISKCGMTESQWIDVADSAAISAIHAMEKSAPPSLRDRMEAERPTPRVGMDSPAAAALSEDGTAATATMILSAGAAARGETPPSGMVFDLQSRRRRKP